MITQPDIIRSGYVEDGKAGAVAVTAEIKDESRNMMQSEVNTRLEKLAKAALVL